MRLLKKFLKWVIATLATLLVFLTLAVLFVPADLLNAVPVVPAKVKAVIRPAEMAFGQKRSHNILLLGVDYNYDSKAQRHTTGARSDTILILRVEREGQRLSMLSIPRDLYVNIPAYGFERINAAYSYGGTALARDTIQKVTGLKIDHHIVVKSDVVADLVDAIGGVPITVEKQMDWDDNWAGLHIHLKPGKQRLTGEQAVGFCRFRQDEEGDFGRIKRQQAFLGALLRELKDKKHWDNYPELARIVRAKMTTDLTDEKLIGLAMLYKKFPLENLKKGRPEVEDYHVNGAACLILAPGEPANIVSQLFPPLPVPLKDPVPVVIKAEESYIEEARRVAFRLKNLGYTSVRVTQLEPTGGAGETALVLHSPNGEGSQSLRETFPTLKLRKEKSKGRPEATLYIYSTISVAGISY